MAQELVMIPTRIPAVQVAENGRRIWDVRLVGEDGEDIDVKCPKLLGCSPNPAGEFEDGIANQEKLSVRLVARDEISGTPSTAPHFITNGELLGEDDDCYEEGAAIARFVIQPSDTVKHGIYEGQVGLFAGETLLMTWPCFVEIEPNLFKVQPDRGGLSVWWVKAAIRDMIPSDEALLDEVEFANYEILHAIRRAVEVFNSALPRLDRTYTTNDFEWREPLLDGVISLLYESAAKLYLRDHLSYQAGGTSINDKDKYTQYQQMASMHRERFDIWTKTTKSMLNSSTFWGTVG